MNRIMKAAVFDSLKRIADAHEGVGTGYDFIAGEDCCCIHGMARVAEGEQREATVYRAEPVNETQAELLRLGITRSVNDRAVEAINEWKPNARYNARVTFEEWAARLGVVRGDA